MLFLFYSGPNAASLNDFWRMAWQEKVGIIVMVTQLIENGKVNIVITLLNILCDLLPQNQEQVAWAILRYRALKFQREKNYLKVKYEVLVFL